VDASGTIKGIDSWEYDSNDGYYPSICNVSAPSTVDMTRTWYTFALAYKDTTAATTVIITFGVWASNGTIRDSPIIDTLNVGFLGNHNNLTHVNGNIYALAYSQASDADGFLKTIYINSAGYMPMNVNDTQEFDLADCRFPKMVALDFNTTAIVYTSTRDQGKIVVYNITTTGANPGAITNTNASWWRFDSNYGNYSFIYHIYGDYYAIAYSDKMNDGWINTLSISTKGIITAVWRSTYEFDGTDCAYPYITKVSGNTYAIAYQNTSNNGNITTLNITNAGVITPKIDGLCFDGDDCRWYPTILWVSGNYYLIVYPGKDTGMTLPDTYDGLAKTITILTNYATPTITNPYPTNGATGEEARPQLRVTVNDLNGDNMNIVWSSNSSGTWRNFDWNYSCSNGTYYATGTNFTTGGTKYYWRVNVTDGTNTNYTIYSFTLDGTLPTSNVKNGIIKDTTVSTYEWDGNEGRYADAIRLGTSEYYLIAAAGDGGSDGWVYTIQVDNVGKITRVDSYQYDTSDGICPSLCYVSGDIYAISYRDVASGKVVAVTISVDNANGAITKARIDNMSFSRDGNLTNFIHVNGNIYAVAYSNAVNTSGFIETCYINPNTGRFGTKRNDSVMFDSSCEYPKMVMLDSDTVAIVYTKIMPNCDGWLCTYNITSTGDITNTPADTWKFATVNIFYPFICHISGNVYAIAYEDTSYHGQVKTCTITTKGMITESWNGTLEFDTADCAYPYVYNLKGDVYTISYQGTDGDGFIKTMNITSAGVISSVVDSFEFNIGDCEWYPTTIWCSRNYSLIVYPSLGITGGAGGALDGWSCVVNITTNGMPYWKNSSYPFTIYGTANDTGGSGLKNVTLQYRYRATNASSWGGWVNQYQVDTDPWVSVSFSFTFPNGTGHYQFHTTSRDNATNQQTTPASANSYDFRCGYKDNLAPTSNVNAITAPYWKKSTPLAVTVTAADTGYSGLRNVTLYYYNSTNNATWKGPWKFGSTNTTPWKNPSAIPWSFTFPNGTGYYRFYSVAYDNASNKEAFTGNDTKCGYDNTNPTSQVSTITPYLQQNNPLAINATASDTGSGLKNATLWYRWTNDNSSPTSISTYYFTVYDTGVNKWAVNPSFMVDSDDTTYASTRNHKETELIMTPNSTGTNTITFVHLRCRAYNGGGTGAINLRPLFSGGNGDSHPITLAAPPRWYTVDITNDTNHPSPWNWSAFNNLECNVQADTLLSDWVYCSMVQIIVGTSTGWIRWNNTGNPDTTPWSGVSWNFNFPNSTGYYQFYSIACDNATNSESAPTSTDAKCQYSASASINVTPWTWNLGSVWLDTYNQTTLYHFNLTNDGGVAVNVQINATNATNATSGFKWNLTSTAGLNNFNLSYYNNSAVGVWKKVNLTYDTFYNNLAVNSWQTFDLRIYLANFTSAPANYTMAIEVTFWAVAV
jgi:hypothetical protein